MAKPAPLRIGLVLDDSLDSTDGVQQYVLSLGSWLTRRGHEVHYLVGETRRNDIPNIHSLSRNMAVRFNGNRLSLPLPPRRSGLRKLMRELDLDVLHVQVPYSPFLGRRLIKESSRRTAVIGTFHILPYSAVAVAGNRLLGLWLRRSLRRFDAIVSVSSAARAFARSVYGIESEVVPNMIDYERFRSARPVAAFRSKVPTILFLGRLVPRKGCRQLLQAVARLHARRGTPEFRVVVCGKGPLGLELKDFADQNGLSEIVQFTGYVAEADKPARYASADIAVFPSSGGESFGIVLLEAMASGRAAVLAGDNPGYASVLEPMPELLFPALDSEALSDMLLHLLKDAAERKRLARWGAGYAAGFDTAEVGGRLLAQYRQALQARQKQA